LWHPRISQRFVDRFGEADAADDERFADAADDTGSLT
jgi:hypothetical protein